MKKSARDKDEKAKSCVARIIDLPRISVFIIEKTENRLVNIFQVPGYERFLFTPLAFHIDEKLKITILYPEAQSLYQLLHGKGHVVDPQLTIGSHNTSALNGSGQN